MLQRDWDSTWNKRVEDALVTLALSAPISQVLGLQVFTPIPSQYKSAIHHSHRLKKINAMVM